MAQAVVDAARALAAEGLVVGTAGNVSARAADKVFITPSAIDPALMAVENIATVDLDGRQVAGLLKRSSEWRLHLAIYAARPDVAAVVHMHSPAATALAVLREPIPPIHYAVCQLAPSGVVPVAPYRTFGTADLADVTRRTLGDAHAVLMANHGAVLVGSSVVEALARARLLEWLSALYLAARTAGHPHVLSAADLAAAREALDAYHPDPAAPTDPH
jgi:L-fuculose-phosphate aldolase